MNQSKEEAREKFEAAIKEYLESQGHGDGILTEWLLITAQFVAHAEGGSSTATMINVSREQPMYRSAGLIEYARIKTMEALTS